MNAALVSILATLGVTPSHVVVYEGTTFPEDEGWERRLAGTPGGERNLVDGWFVQFVALPKDWNEPYGAAEFYRIPLMDFLDDALFFIEWRVSTDNPPWLLNLSATPVVVSAAGYGDFYHTTLTNGKAQLLWRTSNPLVYVLVTPNVAHVYRVELRSTETFAWYIDGFLVEPGAPLQRYPDPTAFLIWGAQRFYVDATTAWDYVRFGVIPEDASGDYDSDAAVSLFDYYFAQECVENLATGNGGGPGSDAGPGCRFADFNADLDVDLGDFAEFQNRFAPADSPTPRR